MDTSEGLSVNCGRTDLCAGGQCVTCVTSSCCLSLSQADATHERVVKREDGERLAKVSHELHT